MEINQEDFRQNLVEISKAKMPYGKYQGRFLVDLPEHYLVWYKNKGFPAGKLGKQMQLIYEIQLNGLEELLRTIRKNY